MWKAATDVGFLYAINHPIPLQKVDEMFETSKKFFALPIETKKKIPWDIQTNNGWENGSEVLDEKSPDLKETYNIGYANMKGKWLEDEDYPGFKTVTQEFQAMCEKFSFQVLSCFARRLGFPDDFFEAHHDITKDDCTKLMRILYYPELTEDQVKSFLPTQFRAGAHTDYGCVTLLFQKEGEKGLEVCPGKDTHRSVWTPVDPIPGAIVLNIGDSLMRWSDDKLKSTVHRVRVPKIGDRLGSRYSIAYFNQPNGSAIIQGPENKYPPISGKDYLMQRFTATYK
jgi:isopenicillin N synthase-like dioxygenase